MNILKDPDLSRKKRGVPQHRYTHPYHPKELTGEERKRAMSIISSKRGSFDLVPVKLVPLRRYQAAHLLFGLFRLYNLNVIKRKHTVLLPSCQDKNHPSHREPYAIFPPFSLTHSLKYSAGDLHPILEWQYSLL